MKILGVFILLIVIGSPVFASSLSSDGKLSFISLGGVSCGKWILAREDRGGNRSTYSFAEMYAIGFLTSYNIFTKDMYNILEGSDLDSASLFVDNYCKQNPLSSVASGLKMLVDELRPSARIRPPD